MYKNSSICKLKSSLPINNFSNFYPSIKVIHRLIWSILLNKNKKLYKRNKKDLTFLLLGISASFFINQELCKMCLKFFIDLVWNLSSQLKPSISACDLFQDNHNLSYFFWLCISYYKLFAKFNIVFTKHTK